MVFIFIQHFFYAYWSKVYVFLLLVTVICDFFIAKQIYYAKQQKSRKLLLLISIIANLSVLGFFKYYNFFSNSLNDIANIGGINSNLLPTLRLILPIGISFYTFQSMSYVIDVYRRHSNAHAKLLEFAGYVTLFPHQISGPLVRHNTIVPLIENSKTYIFQPANFLNGCYFLIFGLTKKILIADRLALAVDPVVANMASASNAEALLAIMGYTMQIYFDFSGYSDMAVGLGLMMNIKFPANFNSPYKSGSITEFWQKWHMTLSSWLRDYLYISLGGNRSGKFKTYRNLLLTMAIGGLWHGANWTYVAWGVLHGVVLACERFFKDQNINLICNKYCKWALTFFVISVAWVFFRSPDFSVASLWLQKIFMLNHNKSWDIIFIPAKYQDQFFFALVISIITVFLSKNTWERKFQNNLLNTFVLALLFVICLSFMGEESPFLYFQF